MRTIAALATPPGVSGLAVIRLSGDESIEIAEKIFKTNKPITQAPSHTIHYGKIQYNHNIIDMVTAAIFRKPNSYTGEDVIEFSCHGGVIIYEEILDILYKTGATPAEAGEFTKRAFINGKIDLTQAEAISDMIHSISHPGKTAALNQLRGALTRRLSNISKSLIDISSLLEIELDFADEDIELTDKNNILELVDNTEKEFDELISSYRAAELYRSGVNISLIGKPNSGKSTLFNAIIKKNRSIISNIPGTTRDYIEERIYINELPINFIDTAGLRKSTDEIEQKGINFSKDIIDISDIIIIINDITTQESNKEVIDEIKQNKNVELIIVNNKIDRKPEYKSDEINISAKYQQNIDILLDKIYSAAKKNLHSLDDTLINHRQKNLLQKSKDYLLQAKENILSDAGNEIITIDIRSAINQLNEITGDSYSEEVLNNIFSKFCIGK